MSSSINRVTLLATPFDYTRLYAWGLFMSSAYNACADVIYRHRNAMILTALPPLRMRRLIGANRTVCGDPLPIVVVILAQLCIDFVCVHINITNSYCIKYYYNIMSSSTVPRCHEPCNVWLYNYVNQWTFISIFLSYKYCSKSKYITGIPINQTPGIIYNMSRGFRH